METREELEAQLSHHCEERDRLEASLAETRSLLDRADNRRKDNPEERSRWNRTLDNLELGLADQKRRMTVSESLIVQIQRRLENGEYASEQDEAVADDEADVIENPAPPSDPVSPDDVQQAVDRLLRCHIIHIQSVSEKDYRLAKIFLDSSGISTLSGDDVRELRKRVSILDRADGPSQSRMLMQDSPHPEEHSKVPHETAVEAQNLLKSALQKATARDYQAISIGELEALASYAQRLAGQTTEKERVTHRILSDTLNDIRDRIGEIPFD